MKYLLILLLVLSLNAGEIMSIYDIKAKDIDGNEVELSRYKNRVVLVVNVASRCGYTSQYEGLEELHEKYHKKGLSILGFPCNQFLSQEPGTEEEIKNFCSSNFGVEFDMFSKVDVNGENTHPLFIYLKEHSSGFLTPAIKWNFTKFLLDREGRVIQRYAPSVTPKQIEDEIEELL